MKTVRGQDRVQREAEGAEKDGRFTGAYAINPFTGEEMPIWMANFVLAGYGTGAIMAVPAHDERDHEFAKKYGLPIREVIRRPEGADPSDACFSGEGTMTASGPYDGLTSEAGREAIAAEAAKRGITPLARIVSWADSLDAGWLTAPLNYRSGVDGVLRRLPAWTLVTHMFNHQTHHRGQAHAMLSSTEVTPPSIARRMPSLPCACAATA